MQTEEKKRLKIVNMVSVLERCQVSPPPGTVAPHSIPLTFFDLQLLHFYSAQQLLFFEFPVSKEHFIQHIVPELKHTLSLTLKHFYPLAGNLIVSPQSSSIPEIRYADGDSVSLIFAESTADFNHLVANHRRNADEFYPLLHQFPPWTTLPDGRLAVPLTALQATLFPNAGICLCGHCNHVVGDGTSLNHFIKTWGLITRSRTYETLMLKGAQLAPHHDRTLLRVARGIELEKIFWNHVKKTKYIGPRPQFPTNKVRVTLVMRRESVKQLIKHVSAKIPSSLHVSTFSVTCGYVWSCMVKASAAIGENLSEGDDMEYFRFLANCRDLLSPPMPKNYFGNCVVACVASAKASQLIEEDGFVTGAKSIGEAIIKMLRNEEGLLQGAENWMSKLEALKGKRIFGASWSPNFKVYDVDFGWGRPRKMEMKAIDDSGTVSLAESREGNGDIEIGLSVPKVKLDAFDFAFTNGLRDVAAAALSKL